MSLLLLLKPPATIINFTSTGPGPQGIAAIAPPRLIGTADRPQGSASAPKAPQGR